MYYNTIKNNKQQFFGDIFSFCKFFYHIEQQSVKQNLLLIVIIPILSYCPPVMILRNKNPPNVSLIDL